MVKGSMLKGDFEPKVDSGWRQFFEYQNSNNYLIFVIIFFHKFPTKPIKYN